MTRTTQRTLIAALMLSSTPLAHANEPINLLRGLEGLKKIIDANSKQSTGVNAQSTAEPVAGLIVTNADEYCQKLKANPVFTEYTNTMHEIGEKWGHEPYLLETQDALLAQWVTKSVEKQSNSYSAVRAVGDWVNECAYANRDDQKLLIALIPNNDRRAKTLEAMHQHAKRTSRQLAPRSVDDEGNIRIVERPKEKLPRFIDGPGQIVDVKKFQNFAALTTIVLPNGEEVLNKIAGPMPQGMKQSAHKAYEQKQQSIAEADATNQEQKDQQIAANKLEQEKEAKFNAYHDSPDGRLLKAYTMYNRVDQCHVNRKGYAAVHVTDEQLATAKKQAKQIETKLKPSLIENTDVIWNKAVESQIGYIGGMVMEGMHMDIKHYNFSTANSNCTSYVNTLQSMSDSIVGKSPVKKAF